MTVAFMASTSSISTYYSLPETKTKGLYANYYCQPNFFPIKCPLGKNFEAPFLSSSSKLRIFNTHIQNGKPVSFKNSATIVNSKIYKRLDSCLVVPPPKGKKPRAIIKFLGGAFIGAVPEVTYSYLLEQLASEGYLIVSVPYNVTFDHEKVTREIFERFHACSDMICTCGLTDVGLSAHEVVDLPLYSVGHSNGALLQALTGSYFCEKIPKANAIISYNNRPASEAVPYFEQVDSYFHFQLNDGSTCRRTIPLGPLVSQVIPFMEASPMYSMAQNASEEAWKVVLDTAETMIPNYDSEVGVSISKFADQLPVVFKQLAQGISEFKPTPSENLDCFRKSYNIQHTLLVKFNSDAIDETDLLEETLKPRVESIGGTLKKVVLSGNHITPCIQEPKWQAGDVYTPADAVAQGFKTLSLNDTRVLSRTIADWFNQLEE